MCVFLTLFRDYGLEKREAAVIHSNYLYFMTNMDTIFQGVEVPFAVGDNAEGVVLDIDRNAMFIDLSPFGTGIIFGREFLTIKDIIKNINVGDTITAQVVEFEGEDGYIELSLKEARKATIWKEAADYMKDGTVLSLPVREANKGGLMISWQGINGFLPASQLGPENYPQVSGGDKNRILLELEKLVGNKIDVQIITVDVTEEKLIFSEKHDGAKRPQARRSQGGNRGDLTEKYNVGDIVSGSVTGVVDFGVFVRIADNLEGLVHISEISWSLVEHPEKMYAVGDEVEVKIIEVEKDKVSLSIKSLKDNPWSVVKDKYQKDQEVEAVVIRYNEHGALVSVEEGVAGLVHVSDFEDLQALKDELSLGTSYKFKINVFDADKQKMTLSWTK